MADKKQDYTITVSGPGHNFERPVDEATAGQILALIMTGAVTSSNARATGGHPAIGASTPAGATPPTQAAKNVSLAAYIKAKKGENSQVIRFIATASWLSGRSNDPLTATAVARALSEHHQKRLANPAHCLNQNVSKGFCEKRKDGSFFITPEGLEALDGPTAE